MIFPIEIMNKIFTYVSNNTACLIRDSRFYQKKFPFFYLHHVSSYDIHEYHLVNDIIDINRIVYNDRIYFNLLNRMSPCQDDLDVAIEEDSDDEEDEFLPLIYV